MGERNCFQGLGIRLDVYEIFNVDSVVVGDPHYDVTCIGQLEGDEITEKQCRRLGFEEGVYPFYTGESIFLGAKYWSRKCLS